MLNLSSQSESCFKPCRILAAIICSLMMLILHYGYVYAIDSLNDEAYFFPPVEKIYLQNTPSSHASIEDYITFRFEEQLPSDEFYAQSATTAGSKLTNNDAVVYEQLKEFVQKVAAGKSQSTKFSMNYYSLKNYAMSTDDFIDAFGFSPVVDGRITQEAEEAFLAWCSIDVETVVKALLLDYPQYMYWYDREGEIQYQPAYFSYRIEDSEWANLMLGGTVEISLPVSFAYAGSEAYTYDMSEIDRVNTSLANARQLVSNSAEMNNIERLSYFKDSICQAVSYDEEAASGSVSFGDPWQLVYVFDDDESTNVVSEGYAKAFKYLCDLADVQDVRCLLSTGTIEIAETVREHMWNIVRMDDLKNYLVDAANCDEGTIGVDNRLFITPCTSGSVVEGYTFAVTDGEVVYTYDSDTISFFDVKDLSISSVSYEKPDARLYEMVIEGASEEFLYDGSERSISGLAQSVFRFDDDVLTVSGLTASASGVCAGVYPTVVKGTPVVTNQYGEDVTARCAIEVANGQLTIKKRRLELRSASLDTVFRDVRESDHSVFEDRDGFAPGEGATYSFRSSQLEVGSSPNIFTYVLNEGTLEDNYDIKVIYGTLKVDYPNDTPEAQYYDTSRQTLTGVSAIKLSPKTPYVFDENQGGCWYPVYDTNGNKNERGWYYYKTFGTIPKKGDVLTFTISGKNVKYTYDDNEQIGHTGFYAEDGTKLKGREPFFFSNQSFDNQWKPNQACHITMVYQDLRYDIPVTINPCPIKSISLKPAKPYELIEGSEGHSEWEDVWDENIQDYKSVKFFRYFWPNYNDGDKLTIKYSDGSTKVFVFKCNEGTSEGDFVCGKDAIETWMLLPPSRNPQDFGATEPRDSQSPQHPWTPDSPGTFDIEYEGVRTSVPVVVKKNIAKATVASIADQAYNGGNAVTPSPKVTYGGKTLVKGTDYTLSYSNNTKEGNATVTISGKGVFGNKKSVKFTIKYMKPSWSGANKMLVKSTAIYTVTNGGYIRLKKNGKRVKDDGVLSINGKTVTAKKAGTSTVYLLDSKGKQIATKKVSVVKASGKYEFQSVLQDDLVLDIQKGNTTNGTRMLVWTRKGGDNTNQQYQMYLQSDGTYAIRSVKSQKWLMVKDSSTDKRGQVVQHSWIDGARSMLWYVRVNADNSVTFVNANSNMAFDVQGGKAQKGAFIIQWDSNNGKNQKWKLVSK